MRLGVGESKARGFKGPVFQREAGAQAKAALWEAGRERCGKRAGALPRRGRGGVYGQGRGELSCGVAAPRLASHAAFIK